MKFPKFPRLPAPKGPRTESNALAHDALMNRYRATNELALMKKILKGAYMVETLWRGWSESYTNDGICPRSLRSPLLGCIEVSTLTAMFDDAELFLKHIHTTDHGLFVTTNEKAYRVIGLELTSNPNAEYNDPSYIILYEIDFSLYA